MSRIHTVPAIAILALVLAACAHGPVASSVAAPAAAGPKHHGVDALLLSCMDYRLTDDVERYMSGRGLRDDYDHVILAGAALGATTPQKPAWNTTFSEHLDVAARLHSIRRVIVIDHRDCGAFKVLLGEDFSKDRAKETAAHTDALRTLASRIRAQQPALDVELYLMDLDGTVEPISETP